MIMTAIFMSLLAAIAAWWLANQDLASKPWLEQGVIGDVREPDERKGAAARVGLWFFLAVAGSLFAILASAYVMRMESPDWRSPPVPNLLWANTGALIVSSVALQFSVFAARRGDARRAQIWLLSGGAATFAFVCGQLLAWRQFAEQGYFLASNPGNSFFYLLTGLHGAHVVGGLAALAIVIGKAQSGGIEKPTQTGIELCARYWHFLLFVWLILFAILAGGASEVVVICRGLIG